MEWHRKRLGVRTGDRYEHGHAYNVIYLKKFPAKKTGSCGVWQISRSVQGTALASRTQVQETEGK
jgi:hypothetical protein